MKNLIVGVAACGALALGLAVLGVLANIKMIGVTSGGYLRGAVALFLLTLVLAVLDQFYLGKGKKK
jgi:hypothetical protein